MFDGQGAEYVNLGNYEDFPNDGETAELLRHITSKSGGVQISLKMYITSKCHIEVPLETTEKNDDPKKLDEQIVEYAKSKSHRNLVESFEVAELEGEMIKSKEYLGNKKDGQNDNYDITGEETSECTCNVRTRTCQCTWRRRG